MRQDSLCKTKTVKVPRGNAFQLLMPFKTAHWEDESIVPEDLDILSLDNVHITIAGLEWTDFEMDPRGPLVTLGADDFDAAECRSVARSSSASPVWSGRLSRMWNSTCPIHPSSPRHPMCI